MKTKFLFIAVAVLALAADAPSAFLPKRSTLKKPRISGGVILQRGPRYEAAESRSTDAVVQQIRASAPGVNDVAAQSVGLQGAGSCSHSATDRLLAINAELQAILAKVQQDYYNEVACGANPSCALYWANQALADANQAAVLGNEAVALQGQAQAEAACLAQGGGGGLGQPARPAGLTYQALAQRFNVPLKGAAPSFGGGGGGGLGGFNGFGSAALDQLMAGIDNGGIPDYDGRGRAIGRAARDYARIADAAGALAGRATAGKALAGKPARDFSDPDQAAQDEYLRINYEELGPKYAALARQRSEKADALADKVAAGAPDLRLPSDAPPLLRPPESAADGGEGLLGKLKEGLADEAQDRLEDKLTEHLDTREKALIGIAKIDKSVFDGLKEMADALPGAVAELGSASQDHPNIDRLQDQLDGFYAKVQKVSGEQMSSISGVPSNPEAAVKSGARSFFDRVFGVGE